MKETDKQRADRFEWMFDKLAECATDGYDSPLNDGWVYGPASSAEDDRALFALAYERREHK
jgi:hypothetical protein